MPITLDGTNGITTPTYGGADTSEYLVPVTQFKNRIINGAMQFAQRGTSFTGLSDDGGQYTLDRWRWSENGTFTGVQTVTQDSSAPVGFTNSLKVQTTTAVSVGTSLSCRVETFIEGTNCLDLAWGTANAKTVTLSFWVRSSLTGTFGGAFRNSADDRSYPFSYTISVADTWEYKTVTVAGDTSGTWLTTTGTGIRVTFSLGAGTNLSATAGSWYAAGYQSATGAVSVAGTLNATWFCTGVQLEVGSTATSFDYRPYGTELALCQRYYEKSYNVGTTPATNTTAGLVVFASGATSANVLVRATAMFSVPKRANPTITLYDNVGNVGKISYIDANGTQTNNQTGGSGFIGEKSFQCESDYATSKNGILFHYTASIEL